MKWVTMWGNAQSICVPEPQRYAKDLTLRYPIFVPFDGDKIRITLDNFLIDEEVFINYISIGISDRLSDEVINNIGYLTFDGKRNVSIKAHSYIKSDPFDIKLNSDSYLIVSIYLKDFTNLCGGVDIKGPLSKGYFGYGDMGLLNKLDINKSKSTSWVYFLSNIDLYTSDNNYSVICYGDSITSQDWPDYMLLSLRENGIKNISVVRKAVSGTRILRQYDCITYQSYGLKGENRFMHEVSSVMGAKAVIVQQGINDIIHPVGTDINIFRPLSDLPTKDELIGGINYYKKISESLNLEFIVGTLLPIYNWRTFEVFREELKNSFNIDLEKNYNCIDFSKEVSYLYDGIYRFKEGYDSGDHLHPSKQAYKMMGILASKKIINDLLK